VAITDLTIVARSLRSRLFSTITTALTVAVAVALLLVLLSMRDAGQKAFARGGGNMHMLVSGDTDPMGAVLNGIFYARPPRRPLEWQQFQRIASSYPLEFAIPVAQGDSYRGYPTLATLTEFFERFQPAPGERWSFRQGHAFTEDFQAVLGSQAAASTAHKIGDQIVLTHGTGASRAGGGATAGGAGRASHVHSEYKFTIVGILEPTGTAHDRAVFIPLQSAWILHAHDRREREEHGSEEGEHEDHADHDHDHEHESLTTAADLLDADRKITGIYLRTVTRPGSNVSADLPRVFNDLRSQPGITVAQPKAEIDRLFEIVGSVNQLLVAIAAVVMVSSGIAIMLALYNSMEQRRRQIAVLRVLGASRGRILSLVLTESAMLGILGAIAGVILALIAAQVVAAAMRARLGLVIRPALPADWLIAVALAAIVLAALAGIIPAVMAYRTSVARNLRPIA
jgi:putative ABC transport system permease protein